MVPHQLKGCQFIGSCGFLDWFPESGEGGPDFFGREQAEARSEDGGFEDRVLGAIEAPEVAKRFAVENLQFDFRTLAGVVYALDFKFEPATGGGNNLAANDSRGEGRGEIVPKVESCAGEEEGIVGDMKNAEGVLLEVLICARGLEGAETKGGEVGSDDGAHRCEVQFAQGGESCHETFENHMLPVKRGEVAIISERPLLYPVRRGCSTGSAIQIRFQQ